MSSFIHVHISSFYNGVTQTTVLFSAAAKAKDSDTEEEKEEAKDVKKDEKESKEETAPKKEDKGSTGEKKGLIDSAFSLISLTMYLTALWHQIT